MNTVIFDLDGTLLPMDQSEFVEQYFKKLASKCMPMGFAPDKLVKGIWAGTKAMIENDGSVTNEKKFWDTFAAIFGEEVRQAEPEFEKFYQNEFHQLVDVTKPTPIASECIKLIKEKGYRLVLATNPIFPRVATLARMSWAGLNPADFDLITTYENSSYCKPNLEYYKDILQKVRRQPKDCLMIGNDVREDMCTAKLGMETYLLNECIINEENEDVTAFCQGDFIELFEFIKELPVID
ncbi:MAG: hypothetical protein K0S47_138 [Herbinix sp.]|jgi:FMN phosphatase YigB (HAD superfamily)|nr:hypothetical protein [Herbinix sp.]